MSQIFFAWVDGSESTFDPVAHAREDDDIFEFTITHEEGQIPVLELSIQYPVIDGVAIGLLRTSRKQWCWLSWRNPEGIIEPLFFGRLVGIPANINDVVVPLRFLAQARDYLAQKQAIADQYRVRPFYDPVFLDDRAMEDPEQILEGVSGSYHVDRVSLQWSVSDLLEGDETVYFDEGDIIDGSVQITAKEAPTRSIRVDAIVHWKQNYRNNLIPVMVGTKIRSLDPVGFAAAFPKPGDDLGGGWQCAPGSYAIPHGGVPGQVHTDSGSWTDESPRHNDGDAISMNWSVTVPVGGQIVQSDVTNVTYGSVGGSTDFLNTPPDSKGHIQIGAGSSSGSNSSSYSATYKVLYTGTVDCALYIRPNHEANNYVETISLTVEADMQPLLYDPDTSQETEVIEVQGQDIGKAFIDYKCITTLSGQAVQTGQIMFPNVTPGPGGRSYQLALNGGTCGIVTSQNDAPLFSDSVGAITTWSGIDWVCVGNAIPSISDWSPTTFMRCGTIICNEELGGWFFFCDQTGFTGITTPFKTIFGVPLPNLATPGARFTDGGTVWVALGSGGPSLHTPAQGQPGNIVASSFFDKDRGAAAIEYLIMLARNKLRTRSRAVEISFKVPFSSAVDLSCRKNAAVHVPLFIPGGWATGKIIAYELSWNGSTGEIDATIRIGCAIGTGESDAATVLGSPTVADLDALEASAQVMIGSSISISHGGGSPEISYQLPPPDMTTNGLRFPLTRDQIVTFSTWVGSYAAQEREMMYQLATARLSKERGVVGAIKTAQQYNLALQHQLASQFYYEYWLRPISDQHSELPYVVNVSKLKIPKHIDLEA